MRLGHINHTGWRWRRINDPRWVVINHRARYAHLCIHREMPDAGVNDNRWLNNHRVGTAGLGKTQTQQPTQGHGS